MVQVCAHGEREGVVIGKVWGGGVGDDGRVMVREGVKLIHHVRTRQLTCTKGKPVKINTPSKLDPRLEKYKFPTLYLGTLCAN